MSYINLFRLYVSGIPVKRAIWKVNVSLLLVALVGGLAFVNTVAADNTVGQCNSIAGQALGIAHRIDQGEALCADLGATFDDFGLAGCIPLLINGDLFLNSAVGQYELACSVFCDPCGVNAKNFGICPFDSVPNPPGECPPS